MGNAWTLTEREAAVVVGSLSVDAAAHAPVAKAVGVDAAPVLPATRSPARWGAVPEDSFSASGDDHAGARAVPKSRPGTKSATAKPELHDAVTALATGRLSPREFAVVWEFLNRSARAVCRSGTRMGPDGWAACNQAEDLAAAALLRLFTCETMPAMLSAGQVAAYLNITIRNLAIDWTRGRNEVPNVETESDPALADAVGQSLPESAEEVVSRRELLNSALRCLDESGKTGPRLVLVARLQFMEGWTDVQIAALPAYRDLFAKRPADEADLRQNVWQDASRARQRLRAMLAGLLRPCREQGARHPGRLHRLVAERKRR